MRYAPATILETMRDYLSGVNHAVVQDFLAGLDWSMVARPPDSAGLPCLPHLDRATEIATPETRPLALALADCRDGLRWGQTYTARDFGEHFLDNYGWVEIFGTRGHFVNEAMAGGFLLLGPNLTYPDHHHLAEEIYIPLTGGALWSMAGGAFAGRAAGEVIHHRSNGSHAMSTLSDPLLALYLWRGGDLAQRSTVAGAA